MITWIYAILGFVLLAILHLVKKKEVSETYHYWILLPALCEILPSAFFLIKVDFLSSFPCWLASLIISLLTASAVLIYSFLKKKEETKNKQLQTKRRKCRRGQGQKIPPLQKGKAGGRRFIDRRKRIILLILQKSGRCFARFCFYAPRFFGRLFFEIYCVNNHVGQLAYRAFAPVVQPLHGYVKKHARVNIRQQFAVKVVVVDYEFFDKHFI